MHVVGLFILLLVTLDIRDVKHAVERAAHSRARPPPTPPRTLAHTLRHSTVLTSLQSHLIITDTRSLDPGLGARAPWPLVLRDRSRSSALVVAPPAAAAARHVHHVRALHGARARNVLTSPPICTSHFL
mmetsp:Transcript_27740/g.111100  ORF Transcript_27740/g.111100 Transcript_27740/m.111100 type:complete len:129 (-) Transcript_27740:1896-2282(-)